MKLFILSALLLCCTLALAASPGDDTVENVSIEQLKGGEFEYLPDGGDDDEVVEKAVARLKVSFGEGPFGKGPFGKELFGKELFGKELFGKDPFGKDPFGKDPFGKDPFVKKRKKKIRRRKPFPRRLRIQLKVFRRSNGGAKYKVYILQGLNIRHYAVTFSSSQQFRFRKRAQRRFIRCLRRNYKKKCMKIRKLFRKRRCTDKITRGCSGDFESFEVASPKTFGKNKTKPKRNKKKPDKGPELTPLEEEDFVTVEENEVV